MFILEKKKRRKIKSITSSAIEDGRIMLFSEGAQEVVFGGKILEKVEAYAKTVAEKHAEVKCKTFGIDFVRFFSLCKRDDILICKAAVNKAWEDSLEVGVKVIAEDFRSLEKKHVLSAYFTFEPEDSDVVFAGSLFENKMQRKRYFEAEKRKSKRLKITSLKEDLDSNVNL